MGDDVGRLGDAFVLVSQSGASTEVIDVLERLGDAEVIAITANGESPLARAADAWLPLGPERDTAVSTLGYTATLLTLGLLTDALLERTRELGRAARPRRGDAGAARSARPRAALRCSREISMLDAIGAGPAAGSAGEAALLAREALLLPAAEYETRQYLHGPLESVAPGYGAVLFGAERELRLADQLAGYGAMVATIGKGADFLVEPDPILQILPMQLLVQHVAELRGLPVESLAREQDDTKVEVGCTVTVIGCVQVDLLLPGPRRAAAGQRRVRGRHEPAGRRRGRQRGARAARDRDRRRGWSAPSATTISAAGSSTSWPRSGSRTTSSSTPSSRPG